jgi:crotonobetainyl-CoA:carnitine CoA-transferase CaiB-like acyl-CoA transferase
MDLAFGRPPRGPLAGIRVLDLSTVVSGPFCTQILGDLGADVVKIESPGGDTSRRLGPPFRAGLSGFFAAFNRNKRSLVLDLKREEAQAVARRLAARADVFVENFRPGVTARLGLDYESLEPANPGLVYVSVNGFGDEGPYRDLPAYDTVIQGLSGFLPTQGGDGPPLLVKGILADKTTSLTAAWATLAALFARERNGGRGQRVVVPMLDAYSSFVLADVLHARAFVAEDAAERPRLPDVHRVWQTADGHVVVLVIEDHQFQGLCRALARDDLIEDPRCATLLQRIANLPELLGILGDELRKWPTAEVVERGRRFGAPVAPVHDVESFLRDPQVAANRTVFEIDDEQAGPLRLLRSAPRFSHTPSDVRHGPPRLGEHGDALLREAGFRDDEIRALREQKVVG